MITFFFLASSFSESFVYSFIFGGRIARERKGEGVQFEEEEMVI